MAKKKITLEMVADLLAKTDARIERGFGPLRIESATGLVLTLHAADGSTLFFDIPTRSFFRYN